MDGGSPQRRARGSLAVRRLAVSALVLGLLAMGSPPLASAQAVPPPAARPEPNAVPTVLPTEQAPASQPPSSANPTAVPSGTMSIEPEITTVLSSTDINTRNAKAGDGFTMLVVPPYPNGDQDFAQAVVHGHVADAASAGQGRKPRLLLAFDTITFSNGLSQPISGTVVQIETKTENATAREALGAGAGAAVGSQTIGRILGGAFGSLVGILGGAVGGFLYGHNDKANLDVATGAKATIQATTPIAVPRRQAPES